MSPPGRVEDDSLLRTDSELSELENDLELPVGAINNSGFGRRRHAVIWTPEEARRVFEASGVFMDDEEKKDEEGFHDVINHEKHVSRMSEDIRTSSAEDFTNDNNNSIGNSLNNKNVLNINNLVGETKDATTAMLNTDILNNLVGTKDDVTKDMGRDTPQMSPRHNKDVTEEIKGLTLQHLQEADKKIQAIIEQAS